LKSRWLRKALQDLVDAHSYVALDNPAAASRLVEQIQDGVSRLADFPLMGRVGRVRDTRELAIAGTPYLVVYQVELKKIVVLTILHGARKWPRGGSTKRK
jgi:addiction module RelE/StbE family toxin